MICDWTNLILKMDSSDSFANIKAFIKNCTYLIFVRLRYHTIIQNFQKKMLIRSQHTQLYFGDLKLGCDRPFVNKKSILKFHKLSSCLIMVPYHHAKFQYY